MGNVSSFTPRRSPMGHTVVSPRQVREGFRAYIKNIYQASNNFQANPHTPGTKAYREWKKEAKSFRKIELKRMKLMDPNYKKTYETVKYDYSPKTRRKLRPIITPSRSSRSSRTSRSWSSRTSRTPNRRRKRISYLKKTPKRNIRKQKSKRRRY